MTEYTEKQQNLVFHTSSQNMDYPCFFEAKIETPAKVHFDVMSELESCTDRIVRDVIPRASDRRLKRWHKQASEL